MSQRDERGACVADLDDAIACRRRATGTRATGTGTADAMDKLFFADRLRLDIVLPAVARRMTRMLIRQE